MNPRYHLASGNARAQPASPRDTVSAVTGGHRRGLLDWNGGIRSLQSFGPRLGKGFAASLTGALTGRPLSALHAAGTRFRHSLWIIWPCRSPL